MLMVVASGTFAFGGFQGLLGLGFWGFRVCGILGLRIPVGHQIWLGFWRLG